MTISGATITSTSEEVAKNDKVMGDEVSRLNPTCFCVLSVLRFIAIKLLAHVFPSQASSAAFDKFLNAANAAGESTGLGNAGAPRKESKDAAPKSNPTQQQLFVFYVYCTSPIPIRLSQKYTCR